jgi:hypothetical protein
MNTITVKTQAEYDALPVFKDYTVIEIRSGGTDWIKVEARGNSKVEAWGNSNVIAWENSKVIAWGNSNVEAWGNSNVEARGNVGVHVFSDTSSVLLFSYAVAWLLTKTNKVICKSKTATKIVPKQLKGMNGWFEANGIQPNRTVILFKRVSVDWKTQENTPNETIWKPGMKLIHPNWNPTNRECGEGKYHACSRPYFCNEFRSLQNDRYVAVKVKKIDMYAWPNPSYPHKIAFRAGEVLYEVNNWGEKI